VRFEGGDRGTGSEERLELGLRDHWVHLKGVMEEPTGFSFQGTDDVDTPGELDVERDTLWAERLLKFSRK